MAEDKKERKRNKNVTEKKKTVKAVKGKEVKEVKEEKKVKEKKEKEVVISKKDDSVEVNSSNNESNKFTFGVWEVVIIMLITVAIGIFIGSYVSYHKYNNRRVSCGAIREDMGEIGTIYDEMLNDYYGEVDKDSLINSAIGGMVGALNDPYASFVSKENAVLSNEELSGEFIGLGVEISALEDYITVVSVFDNSPAAKSGIIVGDRIVSLDGVKYSPNELNDLVYAIKSSSRGDKKVFEILREGNINIIEVNLDEIELQSVTSYLINRNDKNIGVFVINNFANNTYDQFLKNYDELTKNNSLNSIVIDLRSNGGGYLSSAHNVASLFLNKGDIVYQRTNGKDTEKVKSEDDKKISVPVVLLVDSGTASSAEVFASSLRDNLGSTIVGVKTYGKGTIQKIYTLSNGGYVKFTVEEWLTSNGGKVEGVGLVPDVDMPWDPNSESDVQLEKAFEVASTK